MICKCCKGKVEMCFDGVCLGVVISLTQRDLIFLLLSIILGVLPPSVNMN